MPQLVKSGIVGALGSSYYFLNYRSATVQLFGKSIPLYLGIGGALFFSSLFADLVHDYVFPHILPSEKVSEPVSHLMAGASNTVGVTGLSYLYSKDFVNEMGMETLLMLGVGSEVAGTYIYEKFVRDMIGSDSSVF